MATALMSACLTAQTRCAAIPVAVLEERAAAPVPVASTAAARGPHVFAVLQVYPAALFPLVSRFAHRQIDGDYQRKARS